MSLQKNKRQHHTSPIPLKPLTQPPPVVYIATIMQYRRQVVFHVSHPHSRKLVQESLPAIPGIAGHRCPPGRQDNLSPPRKRAGTDLRHSGRSAGACPCQERPPSLHAAISAAGADRRDPVRT